MVFDEPYMSRINVTFFCHFDLHSQQRDRLVLYAVQERKLSSLPPNRRFSENLIIPPNFPQTRSLIFALPPFLAFLQVRLAR